MKKHTTPDNEIVSFDLAARTITLRFSREELVREFVDRYVTALTLHAGAASSVDEARGTVFMERNRYRNALCNIASIIDSPTNITLVEILSYVEDIVKSTLGENDDP